MFSPVITTQAMARIQSSQRRMSAFIIFFLVLFLPASSSPAPFASSSKTSWISCDRQLPGGSGYLVSENYPLQYPDNLSCVYTIPLQPSAQPDSAICLRFQRFRMEKMRDYLEIHGEPWMENATVSGKHYEFTGLGENKNPSLSARFSSVWGDSFCWRPNHGKSYLKLVFHTDISASDLGFYATYKTVPREHIQGSNFQGHTVATAEVGFARSCGVVCFDRSCSGGEVCPSSGAGGCADRSDRSYAHSRCKTTSNAPAQVAGQLACDFEQRGCGSLWTYGHMWEQTSVNHDTVYGPSTGRNFYMVKDFSSAHKWDFITLEVPTSTTGKQQCLSFWYHMNGPDVGELTISSWEDRLNHILWRREGSYGNYWHHTQLSLYIQDTSKNHITFYPTRGSEYRAQIAIDDLSLMEGACPYYDDISCTFSDHHECGWKCSHNISRLIISGDRAIRLYECVAPTCGNANNSRVVLTSPPVAITGPTCLILLYWFRDQPGSKLVVRRGLEVMKEQWSKGDANRNNRLAKYTISPPVANGSLSSRIEIESTMITGGKFLLEDITFVPISCEEISLGSCQNGQFRCRTTGLCVNKNVLCNHKRDCGRGDYSDESNCQYNTGCHGKFTCDNEVCIDNALVCNEFDDCGDGSDEKNCAPTGGGEQPAGPNLSPVALIALIAGCVLIFLIIVIKVGLCLHARYKHRRLLLLRERRLEALRNIGRCNSIDSIRPDLMPPAYDDCIRGDNPAFVLGEESDGEDKRNLPSYSQVIEGGFLMITHPVKSELQRLRKEMQERATEEGTSTSGQQEHQAELAPNAAELLAATETTVAEASSNSGYQDSQGHPAGSDHQRQSVGIENNGVQVEVLYETPCEVQSEETPPLEPYEQEPTSEPADHATSAGQDQILALHKSHHRPLHEYTTPIQLSHSIGDTGRDTATELQYVATGLPLAQRHLSEIEVQPSTADSQVPTNPYTPYQFIDNVEDPRLAREPQVCSDEQGHVSGSYAPHLHKSESEEGETCVQSIKDSPIYLLPHDSCPTHVSLAIWDDSEIHV